MGVTNSRYRLLLSLENGRLDKLVCVCSGQGAKLSGLVALNGEHLQMILAQWKKGLLCRVELKYCLSAFLATAVIVMYLFYSDKPNHDFWLLLHGDQRVEATLLHFAGQRKEVVVNDASSLQYLTRAWRSAAENEQCDDGGITYSLDVSLSTGGWIHCAAYIEDQNEEMSLCFPPDALPLEPVYYRVPLPAPMPDALKKVFSDLRSQAK